jgi:hypothetical protein
MKKGSGYGVDPDPEPNPETDPDTLVRGTDPGFQPDPAKMSRIPNTGCGSMNTFSEAGSADLQSSYKDPDLDPTWTQDL